LLEGGPCGWCYSCWAIVQTCCALSWEEEEEEEEGRHEQRELPCELQAVCATQEHRQGWSWFSGCPGGAILQGKGCQRFHTNVEVVGVLAAQPPPALCLKTWLWYSHSRVLLLQMMEGRVSGRNPLAMCLSQRQTDRGRND